MFKKKASPDSNGHQHLSTIPAGTWVQVCKIAGGSSMIHTLARSNIVHGMQLHVLRNDWGRIIVLVHDRRVALNRDVAYKVFVCAMDTKDRASSDMQRWD